MLKFARFREAMTPIDTSLRRSARMWQWSLTDSESIQVEETIIDMSVAVFLN